MRTNRFSAPDYLPQQRAAQAQLVLHHVRGHVQELLQMQHAEVREVGGLCQLPTMIGSHCRASEAVNDEHAQAVQPGGSLGTRQRPPAT
jgi:hypothetical protein